MARRSSAYFQRANHKGGRKYDKKMPGTEHTEKAAVAAIFHERDVTARKHAEQRRASDPRNTTSVGLACSEAMLAHLKVLLILATRLKSPAPICRTRRIAPRCHF